MGKRSLLLTVYDGRFQEKQVVCAVEEAGSWHHISLQGMFSMYDALTDIADDLHPGWSLLVARDPKMRIVTWKNAPPGAGQSRDACHGGSSMIRRGIGAPLCHGAGCNRIGSTALVEGSPSISTIVPRLDDDPGCAPMGRTLRPVTCTRYDPPFRSGTPLS